MSPAPPRPFDHVLILMFENQYRGYVKENAYFRKLADSGIELSGSFGVMHPSQTNYIVSIAGELCNVTGDDPPPQLLQQRTIVDLIEEAGLEWKAYMDAYSPGLSPWSSDLVPADQYPYVIKHDPFSSYENIVRDQQRWQRIVSQHQFFEDVASGALPHYAWFTPDMWNDGHYLRGTKKEPKERAPALVDQAAAWLEWFFGALAFPGPSSALPDRSLVVVTFDEADFEAAWDQGKKYTYDGPNQVYTVLLGNGIGPGVEEEGYNHYSVLKTVERSFDLPSLGKNDQDSNWLRFLWGERFEWGPPSETPISAKAHVSAAGLENVLHVIYDPGSGLVHRQWDGAKWSSEQELGIVSRGPIALQAVAGQLVLVYATDSGLAAVQGKPDAAWSAPQVLSQNTVSSLALSECNRGSDLMLVWSRDDGAISSRRLCQGEWQQEVATGHSTSGALALGALGHNLLLVFQAPDGHGLAAVTYNTAPYNVLAVPDGKWAGAYDDTTIDTWSPSAAPVGHFAAASSPKTPGEVEPLLRPYRGAGPFSLQELDGVVHLVHAPEKGPGLVEATFSLAGILTPKLAVSYRAGDATTTSNGYGTLAEAGWTQQERLEGVEQQKDGALALARCCDQLWLLTQEVSADQLRLRGGKYES